MSEITLSIQLFGAFREYGDNVSVTLQTGAGIEDVKKALADKLGENASTLIDDSALADEQHVLTGNAVFDKDARLAILPPVCGG